MTARTGTANLPLHYGAAVVFLAALLHLDEALRIEPGNAKALRNREMALEKQKSEDACLPAGRTEDNN